MAIHEVLHAKHSKPWIAERDADLADSEDPDERQLAVDRRLVEEPRMEATGVREFPETGRRGAFIRRALAAAVVDVIVPRLLEATMAEALAAKRSAASCAAARWSTCRRAPTTASATRPARAAAGRMGAGARRRRHRAAGRSVRPADLGQGRRQRRTRPLRARVPRDHRPAPTPAARRGSERGQATRDAHGPAPAGRRGRRRNGSSEELPASGAQSLGDALEQALSDQRDGQLEQLNEDIDLQELLKSATGARTERPDADAERADRADGCPTAA